MTYSVHLCSYHKHSSRGGPCVAAGYGVTHRLIVVRLLAFVEGVVIEGVKEGGIDLTKEHPDLQIDEEEHRVKNSYKHTLFSHCFPVECPDLIQVVFLIRHDEEAAVIYQVTKQVLQTNTDSFK